MKKFIAITLGVLFIGIVSLGINVQTTAAQSLPLVGEEYGRPINGVGPQNQAPGPGSYQAQSPGGVLGIYDPQSGIFYPSPDPGNPNGNFGTVFPTAPPSIAPIQATNTPTPAPQVIFGAVFEDTNKNCVKDPGEKLLDNWRIHRGWASQVDAEGNAVPSACWIDAGTTATISDDTNYRMQFNRSSDFPPCASSGSQFTVNATDPEEGVAWQPSSSSCGIHGYAGDMPGTWLNASVKNFMPAENPYRVDFPMLKQQQAACGTACTSTADCSNAANGCTQCRPNPNGQGSSCQEPPTTACNSTCVRTEDCAGGAARAGCSACVTGANGVKTCQQPPSCGTTCTQASDCAGARNGCTACVPNSNGSGSSCQQPPTCGAACDRNNSSACAGVRTSSGGDCSTCRANAAGDDVCQPPPVTVTQPPTCGSACDRTNTSACAGVRTSAGGDCSACLPNAGGSYVCQPPVACGTTCTQASDCAGARNGCTACVPNQNDQGSSCQQPPSCGTTCTQASDCAGARNGCTACVPDADGSGSSCQTPPSCGSACARDDQCTGARNSSGTACSDCRPNSTGQQVCQPVVACNSSCTRDSDCDAGDAKAQGCTTCLPGSNGQLTCQKNIACNSACTRDSDCNAGDAKAAGCTSCIANKCQTFNEDMCKCDGITFTQIASGQEVTVTNFEKVEGPNIMKAKVQDMTFFFTEGRGANAPVIAKSQPIKATIISQTADKVRYQAQWKVKVPENVKPGVDYQIFAQVKCVKQSEMAMASSNRAVLAETTSNQGFFSRIGSFFSRIFGGNDNTTTVQSTGPTVTSAPTTNPNRESLQLRSFNPNVSASASCRFVNFNFTQ